MGGHSGNLREKDHWEDLDLDGRILKWMFKNWDGSMDSSDSG
jgi:hypothetical protein